MVAKNAEQQEDRLAWAVRFLGNVAESLEEVEQIGRWMKSDDSSDNRNRRQGLLAAANDLHSVRQNLTQLRSPSTKKNTSLSKLESGVELLEGDIRHLGDTVSDTMAESQEFTSALWRFQERTQKLQTKLNSIAISAT